MGKLGGTEWVLREIRMEREKQIQKYEYGPRHDDRRDHERGELAQAACYIAWPLAQLGTAKSVDILWPSEWASDEHAWRDQTYRERLIVAAALLVAEVERLDRSLATSVLSKP